MTNGKSDIVEQLRLVRPKAKYEYAKDHFLMIGVVMREAADEIERLRKICADGVAQLDSNVAEIGRLRADIESLKQYTGVYSQGWQSPYARPAVTRSGDA